MANQTSNVTMPKKSGPTGRGVRILNFDDRNVKMLRAWLLQKVPQTTSQC
jgi:hypothetical protein